MRPRARLARTRWLGPSPALHAPYDARVTLVSDPILDARIVRGRAPARTPPASDGAFVLYWMRVAARGHENPALDAAIAAMRRGWYDNGSLLEVPSTRPHRLLLARSHVKSPRFLRRAAGG